MRSWYPQYIIWVYSNVRSVVNLQRNPLEASEVLDDQNALMVKPSHGADDEEYFQAPASTTMNSTSVRHAQPSFQGSPVRQAFKESL